MFHWRYLNWLGSMTVIAPDCGVNKHGTCIYWWHTIIIHSCTYRDKRSCKKQNIKPLSRDLELNYYHSLLSLVIAKDNLLMCWPLVILSYIDSPLNTFHNHLWHSRSWSRRRRQSYHLIQIVVITAYQYYVCLGCHRDIALHDDKSTRPQRAKTLVNRRRR